MTPTQAVAFAVLLLSTLIMIYFFVRAWRKAKLPKPTPPASPPSKYRRGPPYPPKPPYVPKSTLQPPQRRTLPRSFTNRPGVKQAQVNLKKAGYREDAKPEEEPRRRRRRHD